MYMDLLKISVQKYVYDKNAYYIIVLIYMYM